MIGLLDWFNAFADPFLVLTRSDKKSLMKIINFLIVSIMAFLLCNCQPNETAYSDTAYVTEAYEFTGDTAQISRGKLLYEGAQCGSCHELTRDKTGPALGNVHLYRNRRYLRAFTRNSYNFIGLGIDIEATRIWDAWKPTLMNSNYELSNQDIDDIYSWIAAKSQKLNLKPTSIYYEYECKVTIDTLYETDANGELTFDIAAVEAYTLCKTSLGKDTILKRNSRDNFEGLSSIQNLPRIYVQKAHDLPILQFGWKNFNFLQIDSIDYSTFKIEELEVKLDPQSSLEPIHMFLFLPEYRCFMILWEWGDETYKPQLYPIPKLPKTKAFVLSFEYNDGYHVGLSDVDLGTSSSITHQTNKVSEAEFSKVLTEFTKTVNSVNRRPGW